MKRAELQGKTFAAAGLILERDYRGLERGVAQQAIANVIEGALADSVVGERTVHVARPFLESTPLAKQTRTEWIRTLEPWARSLREGMFGSADPPFASEEWDQAVAWIEEEMRGEVEKFRDVEAVIESKKYRERKERAFADADWLAEHSGVPFALTLAPVPPLAYVKTGRQTSPLIREVVGQVAAAVEGMPEDDGITVTELAGRMKVERSIVLQRVAQARKAGYLKNVEIRKDHAHRLRSAHAIPEGPEDTQDGEVATVTPWSRRGRLMTLAVTAEAMAAVSGFEPHEVTTFLLTGVHPSLARTRVRGSFVLRFRPPTPEEIAKGEPERRVARRKQRVARMKQRLDAALEEAGVSVEEAEKALATLLDRAAESPAESPETVSNKEARPEFPRAVDPVTGEHLIRAPQVTVDFYTPDIRHEDLRKLHGEIRQAWEELHTHTPEAVDRIREEARQRAREDARAHGLPVSASRTSPRGRLTEKDRQLLEIIEDMGGVPDSPPAAFWEEVDQRWVEAGYKPLKKADAHRRHHARVKLKPLPATPS